MRLGLVLVATAQLVVLPVAAAHANAPAWPVGKAERLVERDAVVLMPEQQRAALHAELLELVPRFRTLENLVWDLGDTGLAGRVHNYRYRYSTALKQVQGGLGIVAATCRGIGPAASSKRFEVVYSDDTAEPAVVEHEPRRFGPFKARLVVHTTTRRAIAYRQTGEATSR